MSAPNRCPSARALLGSSKASAASRCLICFSCSLLATLSLAALAPAAYAGRGRESHRKVRRFERERCDERVTFVPQRVVEYRRRSSCGSSTLGGFLGGVAVGAIISSAAQSNAGSRVSYGREPAYYPPPQLVYYPHLA